MRKKITNEKTLGNAFDSMIQEQKSVLYFLIGKDLEEYCHKLLSVIKRSVTNERAS